MVERRADSSRDSTQPLDSKFRISAHRTPTQITMSLTMSRAMYQVKLRDGTEPFVLSHRRGMSVNEHQCAAHTSKLLHGRWPRRRSCGEHPRRFMNEIQRDIQLRVTSSAIPVSSMRQTPWAIAECAGPWHAGGERSTPGVLR